MTIRDEVWNQVIHELVTRGKFKISDLDIEDSQRHTVRRVLKEMESMGFVRRTSEQSSIWRLGRLAELQLDVSDEVIERAKE